MKGLVFIFCLFGLWSRQCLAQEDSSAALEAQVRVGFLFNFAKYTEWPNEGQRPDLRFCFLKSNALGNAVTALKGKDVRGHSLDIVVGTEENLSNENCSIVYLSAETEGRTAISINRALRGKPVLLVTESTELGTIRLFHFDNKLRFWVDADRAKADGLKLSSQLMALSRPLLK